jgi:hypothetical protein
MYCCVLCRKYAQGRGGVSVMGDYLSVAQSLPQNS